MAQFILINTVVSGTCTFKSGSVIDDSVHPYAQILDSGGVMVPIARYATLATSADAVRSMWVSGRSKAECDGAMAAAYQGAVDAHEQAADHVDLTTTTRCVDIAGNSLPAAGVTIHAQDAGGAALNLTTNFTNPIPRRTMNIARSNAGPANVTYRCYGLLPDGTTDYEDVIVAKTNHATSLKALAWNRVTTSVDPVSTSDFATGTGFSVGFAMSAVPLLACIGVAETVVSDDLPSGTVVPTTAPNAVKSFTVFATSSHLHTLS